MVRCAKDSSRHVWRHVLFWASLLTLSANCWAQARLTMAESVNLALKNSGRLKAAEIDLRRATAALAVTKDIFIPSVVIGGGLGDAYGITLTVPTIFTINAQSLVYSAQQRFYIRAAHSDFEAARLAALEARDQTEEDAVMGFLSLVHTQQAIAAIQQQSDLAQRLVTIVQDRMTAHLDSELELEKAQRTALQLKLQTIKAEDDFAGQQDVFGALLGLPANRVVCDPGSVPSAPDLADEGSGPTANYPESPGVLSAENNAEAKMQRAEGDSKYTWRPEVTFAAQYGRISPIENVSDFYNIHGNYNTASIGVQIQLPLLDRVRKQAAIISRQDALHARSDVEGLRADQIVTQRKLRRGLQEQQVAAELADVELKIAHSELETTLQRLKSSSLGPAMTPKDEVAARMQERQKYLDVVDARYQLYRSQIDYLRQAGKLRKWVDRSVVGAVDRGSAIGALE